LKPVLRWLSRQYRSWGLVKRIVLISVGLLLLIQIAVQLVIRDSIEKSVEVNLQRELDSSANVWQRLVDQNAQQLNLGASVLAADFGFRSAVASGDAETIESALENNGARIGATVAAYLGTDFKLKAMANNEADGSLKPIVEALAKSLSNESQTGRLTLAAGRLHQFVMVPIRAPLVVGWVVMGFPVDESLAKDMVSLTSTQVLFVQQDAANQAVRVSGSIALPAEHATNLLNFDLHTLDIAGEEFVLRQVSQPDAAANLKIILLRSPAKARQVFEYMKKALLVIDGLGLLLFAIGSMALVRQVSKPLGLLVVDAQRLSRGDYSQKIEDFRRRDEVGNLARSFDHMRLSIQANQKKITKLAYEDQLTELPNRVQLRERLQEILSGPTQSCQQLAVIVMDIDRLKHINDVLGYGFGDKVLQTVAARLRNLAKQEGAELARVGGGQFALVLPQADLLGAQRMAQKIAERLENPVVSDGQTVDLRAGMGIALWPEHAGDADILLGHAEVAMYAAKRKSVGVQVYDPALDSGSALTLSMLSELRQAIDQNELRLYLQPKVDLTNHRVVAVEALVRWQHPQRGLVPPMDFIPFAEQTGFVRYLTLWMLEEAARQWQSLQPETGFMRVAINLSTRDLMDHEFPAKVDTVLARHNAPLKGFCLEITESAIMDDPERAEATLNQLAASGYKLSIDDFGTGYSSLAYLKRLPVTELKIDKSFVMGMEKSESDAQIVRSTIELAHNLGLSVVAEGVENLQVYQLLGELNCDEGQGYFMSKPMPCDEFVAWRNRWDKTH
jgi:diguanylate cyclase (GGDEF)-like protein